MDIKYARRHSLVDWLYYSGLMCTFSDMKE